MSDTETMTAADLEAFKRWKEQNPTQAPGAYWLDVATHGNAEYDAAILLRVLPDGQTLRMEVKHSGWVQSLWNYIPRQGRRPAAGNGAYYRRTEAQDEYYASADRAADRKRIYGAIPDAAKADDRVGTAPPKGKTPPKVERPKRKTGPKGMTPAA